MKNAKFLASPGKGMLATDEQNSTCNKRFAAVGIEETEENRRRWRELLYTVPNIGDSITGVIMYDETIRQSTSEGEPFVENLRRNNVLTGIKIDTGLETIEGSNDESRTMGLDGLGTRAAEYYSMGARFAKWRCVLKIGNGRPSPQAIAETARTLAKYAATVQHEGLVPIVEPEILTDGSHSINECARITEEVMNAVVC
jgi:fructose-bisphosphate aldolase class I